MTIAKINLMCLKLVDWSVLQKRCSWSIFADETHHENMTSQKYWFWTVNSSLVDSFQKNKIILITVEDLNSSAPFLSCMYIIHKIWLPSRENWIIAFGLAAFKCIGMIGTSLTPGKGYSGGWRSSDSERAFFLF